MKEDLSLKQCFCSSSWYQAATLDERIASLRSSQSITQQTEVNLKKAQQRMERWCSQPSFNDVLFTQRLAAERIGKEEFLYILGEPTEAVKNRLSQSTQWLEKFVQAFLKKPNTFVEEILSNSSESLDIAWIQNIVKPFISWGLESLDIGIEAIEKSHCYLPFTSDTVKKLACNTLLKQLYSMLSRTLVLELNVTSLKGLLNGKSSVERFQSFQQRFSQPEVAVEFFQEYPVLARQIVTQVDTWVASNLEFLNRLSVDWNAILNYFAPGEHPGKLIDIDIAGDKHRGGRSVLLVKFSSGFQIVYKPKCLAIDMHFQELLVWLNEKGSHPPLRTIKIMPRGNYGWVEFVSAFSCISEEEVQRFYERQGCYLALLHVLGATDFHYENIIAAGEQPVLIDLESLFHPYFKQADSKPLEKIISSIGQNSVLRVGLLPERQWSNTEFAGVELSGLGGTKGQLSPDRFLASEGKGTDRMRFVRKQIEMPESLNRPKLNGKEIKLLNYTEAIVTGFTNLYQLLRQYCDELVSEKGFLTRFAEDEVRVVLRGTRYYESLIKESFHPDLLRNALDRDRFFDQLWLKVKHFSDLAVVFKAERQALQNCDIPMFTTNPNSCTLWSSSDKQVASSFFEESGIASVKRHLHQLSEEDLARQLWVIRASLATLSSPSEITSVEKTGHSLTKSDNIFNSERLREQLLIKAQAIGERLNILAWHKEDKSHWLSLELIDEKTWRLMPLNASLYEGLPGIIIFLAYLGAILQEESYTIQANSALMTLQSQLQNERLPINSIGGFTGWGGIIYTLIHLATLWNRPELLAQAEDLVELLPDLIKKDKQFDIIGGAAGCICSLLSLYRYKPSEHILAVAVKCGDHLINHARPMEQGIGWIAKDVSKKALAGFSHGVAGISMALLKLAEVTKEERFRTIALRSIEYERSLFIPQEKNWLDLRNFSNSIQAVKNNQEACITAWCHGAPGIGIARLQSLPYLDEPEIHTEINSAIETTLRHGFGYNHSLCHGDLGNLELLLQASLIFKTPQSHKQLNFLVTKVLENIDRHGWLCGEPLKVKLEIPGLMTGLAGIGYELLRLAEPSRVPSVLVFEPPC